MVTKTIEVAMVPDTCGHEQNYVVAHAALELAGRGQRNKSRVGSLRSSRPWLIGETYRRPP